MKVNDELIAEISLYEHDPAGFVDFAYPWGEPGKLQKYSGPKTWQRDLLEAIGKHLRTNPFMPFLGAIASGHGIGKSAFIGMVVSWGLSTKENTRVVYTANTEPQLRTKTTPEIHKWMKLSIVSTWFNCIGTCIKAASKELEKFWRADAVTWTKENTEAFAGLHNSGSRIIVIVDEGSSVDDKVYEVIQGALTDEDAEIIFLVFGNPTRNTGFFKDIFTKYKKRWYCKQIDSRDVEGTNKKLFAEWAEDHGENSDFFKVRVRGMFPSKSIKQFISTDDIDSAWQKKLARGSYEWAPIIIAIDPAWEGDDELVISYRQGLFFKVLEIMPKNDNDVLIAHKLADWEKRLDADAVFIDAGYGTGIFSVGKSWNKNWQLVWFGGEATEPDCVNFRSQMYKKVKEWLRHGGAIFDYGDQKDLYNELVSLETVPTVDEKIQLESKKSMKKRGLKSPGRADTLAITFAYPVSKKNNHLLNQNSYGKTVHDYDPYNNAKSSNVASYDSDYNPYK